MIMVDMGIDKGLRHTCMVGQFVFFCFLFLFLFPCASTANANLPSTSSFMEPNESLRRLLDLEPSGEEQIED